MKRFIITTISIIFVIFTITSCNNTTENRKIKIGIIDTSISQETIQTYKITQLNDVVHETVKDNDTHGSMILDTITSNTKNYDIYYATAMDSTLTGEIEDIITSIEWCIQKDVKIICMSFATLKDDSKLREKISEAIEIGIIIVASCINYSELDCYPAMYDGVISVSEGINTNASVIINYEDIEYGSCSELTAYVCGKISNELSNGNEDVLEIIKNIKEN